MKGIKIEGDFDTMLSPFLGSSRFSESSIFNESEADENHVFNNDTFTVINGNDKTVADECH